MDLNMAIQAHGEWKMRFRHAIEEKLLMDQATISADNCCALGKWLHGDARPRFGTLVTYRTCVDRHAAFHREAGRVAAAINSGSYQDASRMIEDGTPYATASAAVGAAILALKRESGI